MNKVGRSDQDRVQSGFFFEQLTIVGILVHLVVVARQQVTHRAPVVVPNVAEGAEPQSRNVHRRVGQDSPLNSRADQGDIQFLADRLVGRDGSVCSGMDNPRATHQGCLKKLAALHGPEPLILKSSVVEMGISCQTKQRRNRSGSDRRWETTWFLLARRPSHDWKRH